MKECAEEARALVLSFHSLEALNSDLSVSVKTCQGDLSPCGGGGGGASFSFWRSFGPESSCFWSLLPSWLGFEEEDDLGSEEASSAVLGGSSVRGGSRTSSSVCCCWKRWVAEVNGLNVDGRAEGGNRGQKVDLMAKGEVGRDSIDVSKVAGLLNSVCIRLKAAVLPYGDRAEEVKHRAIGTRLGRCFDKACRCGLMLFY